MNDIDKLTGEALRDAYFVEVMRVPDVNEMLLSDFRRVEFLHTDIGPAMTELIDWSKDGGATFYEVNGGRVEIGVLDEHHVFTEEAEHGNTGPSICEAILKCLIAAKRGAND